MSHAELLKQLIASIEASDISQGHREQIMRPVEDLAMEEVTLTVRRLRLALMRDYHELGVVNIMQRFYTTQSGPEARVIWEACGNMEDASAEDFRALWEECGETIPQWKDDILNGVSFAERRSRR